MKLRRLILVNARNKYNNKNVKIVITIKKIIIKYNTKSYVFTTKNYE